MPVKLYQIGGSWYTWDDVHNALGYCDHATTSTTYKTIASWGTEYPMTGYCDTSSGSDVWTWLYFVPGVVGWYDLEDLAAEGYYPASATDIQVSKDGAVSNAAYIEVDGNNYYLVQQDLSQGWMSEAELLERGWSTSTPTDDPAKPLTFKATADGSSVRITKTGSPAGSFEYSTDDGATWSAYTIDTAISLNNGDSVSFRAVADRTSDQGSSRYFHFVMSGMIEAYHNAMSLIYASNYEDKASTGIVRAFYNLFNGCTALTRAPLLPATELSESCYWGLFKGCSNLTQATELPATILVASCYRDMFYGCSSLEEAPGILARTMSGTYCCHSMFYNCTSLIKAPELYVTALTNYCYNSMFYGCSSLALIKCHATSFGTSSVVNWLSHVSETGDFYANPNTTWQTGSGGIPSGWTRHDLT